MNIEERIAGKNTDELSNIITEVEKELNETEKNMTAVKKEMNDIDRQILELRVKKKGLDDVLDQGRDIVRGKKLELRIATNAFWRSKENR